MAAAQPGARQGKCIILTLGNTVVAQMVLLRPASLKSVVQIQASQLEARQGVKIPPTFPSLASTHMAPPPYPSSLPLPNPCAGQIQLVLPHLPGVVQRLNEASMGQHTSLDQPSQLPRQHKCTLQHVCNSTGLAQETCADRGWTACTLTKCTG